MNLVIKEKKEIETIIRLNKYVHDVHHNNHPDIFAEYNYQFMSETMGEQLKKDDVKSIIMYDDETPIGYAVFFKKDYPEHFFKKGYSTIFIDQMCVIPEYQRKGLGDKIINRVKQYCMENEITRLELCVWTKNSSAKSFYEKLGFESCYENMQIDIK